MKQQHAHTLQAIFSHPLQHGLRMTDVETLLRHLGGSAEHLSDHRLKLQLGNGNVLMLHAASGLHHAYVDEEGVLRLRRFLQRAGVSPQHQESDPKSLRGDQSKRLVMHLDHRGAKLWWLEGDAVRETTLEPHGLWGSHQRLTHRHDRDVAGQRAPLDFDYLNQLSKAVLEADRVLLLGHGHGQSNARQLLSNHLEEHHPGATEHLDVKDVDDTACSDAELIALARKHFGNLAHRSAAKSPFTGADQTGEP